MLKVTDKVSLNFVWKENSINEVNNALTSRNFFVGNDGRLLFSVATYTNDIIMKLMTGGDDTPDHDVKDIKNSK